ncbi:hypothetical protein A2311_00910 [candidate division WOR-1 bacterium RIFOXYB2_FULL_48_7]|uniref:Molybdopterin oxidoreductase domain-containing protein n=1 Tax=candidate division WOR-1 bacterium RIFOXYB2_FULL_48_7 TaxID=1802583 RepID=A0A1F4TSK3_UNCSA|nr:MAG: hypothetical protein A2311_00910 [candidate division WOR-1 bacterium RIFOXYB2_FULL_48_7]
MVTKKTKCLFCSLGCELGLRLERGEPMALDYPGPLCPRGHYNLEMINHPARLTEPKIGNRQISWEEAVVFTRQELKQFEKSQVGILISANSSNEEALAAARFAKLLGTSNLAVAGPLSDLAAYQGEKTPVAGAALATEDDIASSNSLVIVGDILTRSPVLSKIINKVKYGQRGNSLIVIDPNRSHTSWFATDHLAVRPGSEALVLASLTGKMTDVNSAAEKSGLPAARLVAAAKVFAAAAKGTVIIVPGEHKARNDLIVYFAKELAAASANKKYVVFYQYGNTLGVNRVLDRELPDHLLLQEMVEKIENQSIPALFMFGENISTEKNNLDKKMRLIKFVAVAGYFGRESSVTSDTVVTFPLASPLEKSGNYTLASGTTVSLNEIVLPVGAKSNSEIMALLGEVSTGDGQVGPVYGQPVNFSDQLGESLQLATTASVPLENITHFGNNRLVKNFFWYKVNNHNG